MMTKRLMATAVLWMAPAALAVDPVALLPENTMVCGSVMKPEKLAALQDHPVVKAVKPGRLKELFGKLVDALGETEAAKIWQEECGMPPGEILAKFSGAVAIGGFDIKSKKSLKEGEQTFEVAGAAAFTGDEKLAAGILRALAKLEAGEDGTGEDASDLGQILQAKENTGETGGVTIHILQPESQKEESIEALAWCVRDGMLMAASGEKPLRAMLERAEAGKTEGSFAATKTWKSAKDELNDPDALLTVNFGLLVEMAMKEDGEAAPFSALASPLGLDRLETFALGMRSDEKALEFKVGVACSSLPWYFEWLKRAAGAEPPKFIPADVSGISWAPIDFGTLLTEVLKKVPSLFPAAKEQVESALTGYKKMTGVDLEKEILQQMGTGYFQANKAYEKLTQEDLESEDEVGQMVNIVSPQKEGAVLGIRLKDPKIVDVALRNILEKLFKTRIALDAREYMGWKIHTVKTPPPAARGKEEDEEENEDEEEDDADAPPAKPVPVSLVIADDWLLVGVGRQELLESILGAIKSPPAENVWTRADIQRGLKGMPDGEVYANYEDLSQVGPVAVLALLNLASLLPGTDFLDDLEEDPADLIKGMEFPLHSFSKYHTGTNNFNSTTRIVVSTAGE